MPNTSIAVNDVGDETASRFRYQYTLAAITCCKLFDKTLDVEEVYCEYLEDVLIKHFDGTFTGLQVKTRDKNQPLWKTGDNQITGVLKKFVHLEDKYSDNFRSFHFLTNHPLHVGNATTSLPFILETVAKAKTLDNLTGLVERWLKRFAKTIRSSEIVVFRTLQKTTASCNSPKLQDAITRLIQSLADCWEQASECSLEVIRRAAQGLVDECARASALDHRQLLPTYLLATHQEESEAAARLDGKRMTLERVQRVLQDALESTATLTGSPQLRPVPGQGSTQLLQTKLDAGGFSIVTANSAEDLRDKAEYLGISWTKRLGRSKGLKRYEHIRSLVLSDASRAFEISKEDDAKFGPAMREALRHRFRERRANNEQLYDYSDEHLEGMAYSLTAHCKVHWSIDRPWETI